MASRDGAPLFCGDAIADPLTGMHAALAAWASWRAGGGHLLDLALRDVAADAAHGSAASDGVRVSRADGGWVVEGPGLRERVRAARARPPRGPARALGADTEAVLRSPDA